MEIRNLRISCIIGDQPEERLNPQALICSLFLDLDISSVAQSDRLEDTVDYVAVADLVRKTAHAGRFHMIETFAAHAAHAIRTSFPQVKRVHLSVFKPNTIPHADGASIELSL